MNYYKFTRTSGTYQIAVKDDLDADISNYFNGDIIFSDVDETTYNGQKFVKNKDDGLYYESYNQRRNKANFTKSVVSEATVSSLTHSGLTVYDTSRSTKKEIGHVDVDTKVMLNLGFTTDTNGNIWASISYQTESGEWKDGYIIYKNYRNAFANVGILNFRYGTVLTNGAVDNEKVAELRTTAVISASTTTRRRAVSRSMSVSSTSNLTTTYHSSDSYKQSATFQSASEPSTANSTWYIGKSYDSNARIDSFGYDEFKDAVAKRSPSVVQNVEEYPTKSGKNTDGIIMYDYQKDGTTLLSESEVKEIYLPNDLGVRTLADNFEYNASYYNRFKKPMPDDILTKGFMHIFFTRPDLNIIKDSGNALTARVEKDNFFKYKWKQRPDLVRELVKNSGTGNDFMMFLSNKAGSFSLTDESIKYSDYGKNFQNFSIQLGRSIYESQAGGTFDIKYVDDRDFNVMALHKMWIQYISNVYHGTWIPKKKYIWQKIIDYAVSCYVIVTAEDFETILYWSKYYGVFPINVPYSAISWDTGNFIGKTENSITYAYSWKEDWNLASLTELNMNCFGSTKVGQAKYVPTYNNNIGAAGTTWVGAPFVETLTDADSRFGDYGAGVQLKLRFLPGPYKY